MLRHYYPSIELTLSERGGLSTKKFWLKCVNDESSTKRCSNIRQVNRSHQTECQDLSQHWLDKFWKAFSSKALFSV